MEKETTKVNEHVYFINQLYRDFLLPEIMGKDTAAILYWAGKRVARHYDLSSFEDLAEFFDQAEYGTLTKVKERRASIEFELSGQVVIDRLNSDSADFSLESGMISEAVQREFDRLTECEIKIDQKRELVQFTARF